MCSYVAGWTQFDAPKRSRNGLQARFAATGQSLYSDIWPIVVSGVVTVVGREFAVQTNRFRKFGRCNAIVSVKGVVVRSFYYMHLRASIYIHLV